MSNPSRRDVVAGLCAAAFTLPRTAPGQTGDGVTVLRTRMGSALLRGANRAATPVWGFDGATPGPVLRVKRGVEVKARLINELAEPTTIHWHGVRLPNAMDGVPNLTQAAVGPGASFDYRFTPPDAGTFWYHADTTEQLSRGLYGALIVDEAEPIDVDRDVVLVLGDWRLDGGGDPAPTRHLTANGMPVADVAVKSNERLRLRFINAAASRIMALRLDGHRAFVVAIDGQPAELFPARDGRVLLAPGNRIDLIVDASLEPGARAPILAETLADPIPVARLVYDAVPGPRAAPRPDPTPLPANPLPARMEFGGALKHELSVDGRTAEADPGARLFSVKRGRTVMLALNNRTTYFHIAHLHGHHCRLLDRLDDGWKPFWLDTVMMPPRQVTRVAFVADNPGKWLIRSRMLEQPTDSGTTGWFEVI